MVSITNFEQIPGCSGYDATKVKNLICYSTPLEKPTCHNIYKSSLLDECFSLPSLRCIKGTTRVKKQFGEESVRGGVKERKSLDVG